MKNPVVDGVESKGDSSNILGISCDSLSFTQRERELLYTSNGCPVNKNIKTKMSRASFIRLCKINKEKSDRKYKRGNKIFNLLICQSCPIGKNIEKGKNFDPPPKIEFLDLHNDGKIRKITNKKLDERKVLLIRKMYNDGKTITYLAIKYKLSSKCIFDIVNRNTWKHI
jgi:hypothetical protein